MPKKVWTVDRDAQLLAAVLRTSTISYDWPAIHAIMNRDSDTEITLSALNHRVRHFKDGAPVNNESAGATTSTGGSDDDAETKATPVKKGRAVKKDPAKSVTPRKRKPSAQASKIPKSPKIITRDDEEEDTEMETATSGGRTRKVEDTIEKGAGSSLEEEEEDKTDETA